MAVSFNPVNKFEVGNEPNALAIGDFNGDGKQDLVTANYSSDSVSVLFGDDNGNFGPAQNFDVGNEPFSVTVGDFNGDGISDLATVNEDDGNVSVLLGDGTGNFSPAQNFEVGGSPGSIAVGDFNGDGISDLATANRDYGNVSVLLGNGAGGFSPAQNFEVGGYTTLSLDVGDFNGDGISDIVTANFGFNGDVSVLLADGAGSFSPALNFNVGDTTGSIWSVKVGDLNNDGKDDLVTANVDDTVSLLLGDGIGGFSNPQSFTAKTLFLENSLTLGDFNGDGNKDLATANLDGVSVLLGDGNGGISLSQNFEVEIPSVLTAKDINNDGKDDLVTDGESDQISVLTTRDNNPPTDLTLSNDTVAENNPFNAEVGTFTTTDPNTDDTFTYELVTGEGDSDNSSFSIDGSKLIAKDSFDFETKSSYDIRVKTTDAGNESFEKTLTINISDVLDTPTIRTLTDNGNEMEVIDLTGNPGETVIADFEITRDAGYDNNVYFYKVDGDNGNIGGLTPDDSGYLQTALNNVVNPDFGLSATQDSTNTGSLDLEGGDILGVVIVADGTLEQAISNIDSVEGVYLSYMGAGASTDNGTFDHIRFNSTTSTFEFEDLANGGDQDFNDLKIKIDFDFQ